MNTAQVHCPGCKKVFTPRGFSQHISRSQRADCRIVYAALQKPLTFQIGRSPQVSAPTPTSQDTQGDTGDDTISEHNIGTLHAAHTTHDANTTRGMDVTDDGSLADADVPDTVDADAADHLSEQLRTPTAFTDDTADAVDANVWEALVQDIEPTVDTDQGHASGVQLSPSPPSETPHPLTSPPDPPICNGSDSNTTGSQAQVIVDSFPHGVPGTPMPDPFQGQSDHRSREDAINTSVWAPFHSQCDWEIALWAKMCRPTSSALTELLQIPEVTDRLGVSYSSAKEIDRIIDTLPGRPPFECEDFTIGGERLSFYFRNVLQCIQTLFGDPEFAHELAFAPERHYSDPECTCRIYSEMHTGDWWWAVQTSLELQQPSATVVPLILSSDKTQLILFQGKAAYPVYLTIGNIPKATR
ncbi:hypothetical protein EDB86DRAFT_3075750 [Lactarius hatsudake]|nr:hypothetical protein EDB86DRAFT_3075750 [Lactarius hatsudake]